MHSYTKAYGDLLKEFTRISSQPAQNCTGPVCPAYLVHITTVLDVDKPPRGGSINIGKANQQSKMVSAQFIDNK